ncbi:YhcN/YlaJ family sporulation lipoprotein [Aquibacillus kalidii]|uniref:YhcN/YlaJ family sporulation lipoprotein n=1 Tax=Aquibacillus kalidii TaxID=2762597 RepID=UPI001647401A|nr:YhcN/YlaJ family sporulation lipoprotein [Aquibacillus kalidii]
MRKTFLTILIIPFFLFVGCANKEGQETSEQDPVNEYPLTYQTQKQKVNQENVDPENISNNRSRENYLEGYQGDLPTPDQSNHTIDERYPEKSKRIAEAVNDISEVKLTQVTFVDDQVQVAVMLEQEEYKVNIEDIIEKIEQRTEQLVPNKEVRVFTDAIYWNQMRNRNAGWID